jgi:hypothetical protein
MNKQLKYLFVLILGLSGCVSKSPQEEVIRETLTAYFKFWSQRQHEQYAGCFHPLAKIFYMDQSQKISSASLTEFLYQQKISLLNDSTMKEYPLDFEVMLQDNGALAKVKWQLDKGAPTQSSHEQGYDLFTLINHEGKWKIISLLFYKT